MIGNYHEIAVLLFSADQTAALIFDLWYLFLIPLSICSRMRLTTVQHNTMSVNTVSRLSLIISKTQSVHMKISSLRHLIKAKYPDHFAAKAWTAITDTTVIVWQNVADTFIICLAQKLRGLSGKLFLCVGYGILMIKIAMKYRLTTIFL